MDPLSLAGIVMSAVDSAARAITLLEASSRQHEPSGTARNLSVDLAITYHVLQDVVTLFQEHSQAVPSEMSARIGSLVAQIRLDLEALITRLERLSAPRNKMILSMKLSLTRSEMMDMKELIARRTRELQMLIAITGNLVHNIDPIVTQMRREVLIPGQPQQWAEQAATQAKQAPNPASTSTLNYADKLGWRQRKFFEKVEFSSRSNAYLSLPLNETDHTNATGSLNVHLQKVNDSEKRDTSPWQSMLDTIRSNIEFDGDRAQPTLNQVQMQSILHLVICDTDMGLVGRSSIPFSRESYTSLMETFCLPSEFLVSLWTGTPTMMRIRTVDARDDVHSFVMRMPRSSSNNWTLALNWAASTRHTTALVHGFQENEREHLIGALDEFKFLPMHPLLLPVLMCELLTEADSTGIKSHATELARVEGRTVYLKIEQQDVSQEPAGSSATGNEADEFEKLTRSLNALTSRLAFHEMRINANVTLVRSTLYYIKKLKSKVEKSRGVYEKWQDVSDILEQRLTNLQVEHAALLLEASCNQKIAQSQVQIVFNLIAQRDNKDSLRIAEISKNIAAITKNDSYAMRTMAVMTVGFLPATAISSIFSMSMFDWHAEGNDTVVSGRFWVYWIVAIPLTLLVIVGWQMRMQYHGKKERESSGHIGDRADTRPHERQKSLWNPVELSRRIREAQQKEEKERESSSQQSLWNPVELPCRLLEAQRVGRKQQEHNVHNGNPAQTTDHPSVIPVDVERAPAWADTFVQGPMR